MGPVCGVHPARGKSVSSASLERSTTGVRGYRPAAGPGRLKYASPSTATTRPHRAAGRSRHRASRSNRAASRLASLEREAARRDDERLGSKLGKLFPGNRAAVLAGGHEAVLAACARDQFRRPVPATISGSVHSMTATRGRRSPAPAGRRVAASMRACSAADGRPRRFCRPRRGADPLDVGEHLGERFRVERRHAARARASFAATARATES